MICIVDLVKDIMVFSTIAYFAEPRAYKCVIIGGSARICASFDNLIIKSR
jgi:hypothetical protein